MVIMSDHIIFDGDTAWWVKRPAKQDGITDPESAWMFDRPCDACDGSKYDRALAPCPDCSGTGRHTFDIEVEAGPLFDGCGWGGIRTYRVSIVPGMVLPITNGMDEQRQVWPQVLMMRKRTLMIEAVDAISYDSSLPSAAKPGMWAIQLKVAV